MNSACLEKDLTVLDYETLVERCVGNTEFAERVLRRFLGRCGEDLEQLEREFEQQNGAAVTQLAHRIKGASSSVSAVEMSQQAARMERLGREDRLDDARSSLQDLQEAWSRFTDSMVGAD